MAIIDYNEQKAFAKSIDVVDIGNTALRAISEDGVEYYIITKALDGKVSTIKFGPVLPEIPLLLDSFNVVYKKVDYKEGSIIKDITQFVNDAKKKISEVEEISESEAFQNFPDIEECYNNL